VKGLKSVEETYVINLHNISPPVQFFGVELIDQRPRERDGFSLRRTDFDCERLGDWEGVAKHCWCNSEEKGGNERAVFCQYCGGGAGGRGCLHLHYCSFFLGVIVSVGEWVIMVDDYNEKNERAMGTLFILVFRSFDSIHSPQF
jgi:hypothetical protein